MHENQAEMMEFLLEHHYDEPLLHSSCQLLANVNCVSDENQQLVDQVMTDLAAGLYSRRLDSSDQEWNSFVFLAMRHPLKELLHEDPFTRRAFEKPRGYAGDAPLLDFVYRRNHPWPEVEQATPLGKMIYRYTTAAPASEASRARCREVAKLLDHLAGIHDSADVLSIACGHLREADISESLRAGRFRRFLALDSDAASLETAWQSYGHFGVEVVPASIRHLLTKNLGLGQFDCIYSTGLFDYLQQGTAERLTWQMFQMLKPGGRMLIANVMPGARDIGYMESFMDWKLVYRTRKEMMEITMNIPQADIADIRVYAEDHNNIILLHVVRK